MVVMERSSRFKKDRERISDSSEGDVDRERLVGKRRMWFAYGSAEIENGRSVDVERQRVHECTIEVESHLELQD